MARLNWRTEWNSEEMVNAMSSERTFGLAGVIVSKTTLMWVMELTPELRALLAKNGYHPTQERKFLVYWERPGLDAVYGEERIPEPFLWEVSFSWLTKAAKMASRVWWTDYIKFPATAEDCLPDGVPVSEIFVLQV